MSDLPLSVHLYRGTDHSDFNDGIGAKLVIPRSPAENTEWVIYYSESRNVPWSLEEEVVEYDFKNSLNVSRQDVEELLDRLSAHLNSDSYSYESHGLEDILIQGKWHGHLDTKSSDPINLDEESLGLVFGFLKETKLNTPRPPKSLRINFNINDMIVFLSDDPLENLRHYTQKKLERVEDLSSEASDARRVRLFFDDDNGEAVPALEGVLEFVRPSLEELIEQEVWFLWSNHERTVFQGASVAPLEITVKELLAKPNAYDGKRVSVNGYFSDGFEAQHLYGGASQYVWLGEMSPIADKRSKKRSGQVTVEGVFFKGPSGHFGMSPGEITRITSISGWYVRDLVLGVSLVLVLPVLLFGFWFRSRKRRG